MRDDNAISLACDSAVPNVARIYDYYLGGKDNYKADRDAACAVLAVAPDVPLAALENRAFLQRVAQYLVTEAGINQFIDIGPGLPTQENLHQIVHQYNPLANVVYVDNDPVVLTHGRSLLKNDRTHIVAGDLRQPEHILADELLRTLIDLSKPVALCLTLVLQFIPDNDDPCDIMARLASAVPADSCLVLSHVTADEQDAEKINQITGVYDEATVPLVPRSKAEVTKFFDGFDLIEPGVVFLSQWRPSREPSPQSGTRWAYAGVGRKRLAG